MNKEELKRFIEGELKGTDYFLTDLKVSASDEITVEIDSYDRVSIDDCIELTRKIEEAFPRDEEDYELEVGSAGITSPFKVAAQYVKNIGNPVEVLAKDGKKYKGTLTAADDEGFAIQYPVKVKKEGEKRPVVENEEKRFAYPEVKQTVYELKF